MTTSNRLGIGFAGRIGSGKSFAARHVAQRWGFQYLRYSQVLAEWFSTNPDSKDALQKFGWDVMSGASQHRLNELLIARIDPDRNCAIDGLRHIIDYEQLKQAFGDGAFSLIFINVDAKTRFERLRSRFRSHESFVAADGHPVESNIDSLMSVADIVLSGDAAMNRLTDSLDQFVARLQRHKS